MKYLIALLLFPTIALAQVVPPPDPATKPSNWVSGGNTTPIANTTPVVLMTAIPTPTGTPAAQLRYYIGGLTVSNSSASVDTDVQLLNGTTVKWNCPAGHNYQGCAPSFNPPLVGLPGIPWSCKSVTTGAAITCYVNGYKSPN